jgi:hypothetical protein
LHLKMLTDADTPLIDQMRHPPVDCNLSPIDLAVFPIQHPHPNDLRLVMHRIERGLVPSLGMIIAKHDHAYDFANPWSCILKASHWLSIQASHDPAPQACCAQAGLVWHYLGFIVLVLFWICYTIVDADNVKVH